MAVSLQIKKGMYYAVFRVTDEAGNEKQKWVSTKIPSTGHKKREAMAKAKEIASQYEQTHIVDYPRLQFWEWIDMWLEQRKNDIDIVTYEGYLSYINNHIKPHFKKKKIALQDLKPQDIQAYYNAKRKDPHKDTEYNKNRLGGKSLKNHHVVIKGSLDDAVKKCIIAYNPADRVTVPKVDKFTGNFLTNSQAATLLSASHDDVLYPLLATSLFCGLRKSEALGLKWSAINFDLGTLSIESTRVRFSTMVCKDKTKTQSSHRTYPMTKNLAMILRRAHRAQLENKLLYGQKYQDSDYVFTWPDGRLFSPDFVTRHFQLLLKKAGLPKIRFHDLRHTTASLLIADGYQLKDIQEWLGHSDIGTTANLYGHLSFEAKKKLADNMGDLIQATK